MKMMTFSGAALAMARATALPLYFSTCGAVVPRVFACDLVQEEFKRDWGCFPQELACIVSAWIASHTID